METRPAAEARAFVGFGDQKIVDVEVAGESQRLSHVVTHATADIQRPGIEVHIGQRLQIRMQGDKCRIVDKHVKAEQRIGQDRQFAIDRRRATGGEGQ